MVRTQADATVAKDPGVSGFSRTAQSQEVVVDVRIQGNVLTSDEEMRRLAGIEVGSPFTADLPAIVADRLKATHKFDDVQVLKRYASIADPSRILLVVIVNEGPV